ncbi:MAG: TIR domain-containing protein [Chloroflexi bacterium]|nr:TIR domain-containing protein [Chloroflexota bacterium]
MAAWRNVFFSFHYERDVWRAANVRKSQQFNNSTTGKFRDIVDWEELKRKGDAAVKKWINDQLNGSSVTVVLIGAETYTRKWVLYEIEQSLKKGNGILGVYINNIETQNKSIDPRGSIPLPSGYYISSDIYNEVYDWHRNDGRTNLSRWIDQAAKAVGR